MAAGLPWLLRVSLDEGLVVTRFLAGVAFASLAFIAAGVYLAGWLARWHP